MNLVLTSECRRQGNMLSSSSSLLVRPLPRPFKVASSSSGSGLIRLPLTLIGAFALLSFVHSSSALQQQQPRRQQQQQQQQIYHHRVPLAANGLPGPFGGAAVGQQVVNLVSSGVSAGNSHQHPDAPKLVPLSALDRYQEGGEVKLFCSAGSGAGRLQFEWRKSLDSQPLEEQQVVESPPAPGTGNGRHVHIAMMDDSATSVLRISQLDAEDSGNYTCFVRNQHGFDASSVRVEVNVRLKWIREPPSELQVRAGKSIQLDCDASGQPAPLISWTSLRDHHTVNSKVLRFDRAQVNDSGLYECRATNQQQRTGTVSGDHLLRKIVKLIVNGK